jgi:hypothetical protein
MNELTTTPARATLLSTTARWMVTFLGFPLGGFVAGLIVGAVDGPVPAILGGLIAGARWIAATAIGLALGLGIGAAAVDYATDLSALVIQGAICGIAVGAAQAVVLRPRLGRLAYAWPPALAALWAAGWAISTSIGVQVDEQFIVFGSSGAIVVTALTAVLPIAVNRSAS